MSSAFNKVTTWTPEEVANWMEGLNAASVVPHVTQFVLAGITGDRLLGITFRELEQLGVNKVGHQEMILEAVDLLCSLQSSLLEDSFTKLVNSLTSSCRQLVQLLTDMSYSQLDGQSGDEASAALDRESQLTSAAAAILTSAKKLVTHLDRNGAPCINDYRGMRQMLLQGVLSISSSDHQGSDENAKQLIETCNSMIRLTEKLLGDYAAAGSPNEIPVLQTVVLSPQGGKGLGFSIRATFEGMLVISTIIPNSPADLSNMMFVGDELIEVNGRTVVGWELARVVAELKKHRFSAAVTLKHVTSGSESISVLQKKASTGAIDLSSTGSSVSSLSSVGSRSSETRDRGDVGSPTEDDQTGKQIRGNMPCDSEVDKQICGKQLPHDSGHSSATEQAEESEKQQEISLLPVVADNSDVNMGEHEDETNTTTTDVMEQVQVAEQKGEERRDFSDEDRQKNEEQVEDLECRRMVDEQFDIQQQESEECVITVDDGIVKRLEIDQLQADENEAVLSGVVTDNTEPSSSVIEKVSDSSVQSKSEQLQSMENMDTKEDQENEELGLADKKDEEKYDEVQSEDSKPTPTDIPHKEEGTVLIHLDNLESSSNATHNKPHTEGDEGTSHGPPPLLERHNSSSLPATPIMHRVDRFGPLRETHSAQSSPVASPATRRRAIPRLPPPPKEPHPDDLILMSGLLNQNLKLNKGEQKFEKLEGDREVQKLEGDNYLDRTGSAGDVDQKMFVVGVGEQDENVRKTTAELDAEGENAKSDAHITTENKQQSKSKEPDDESKKTEDVPVKEQKQSKEGGNTPSEPVSRKTSEGNLVGGSPCSQKKSSRARAKISAASSSGSIHSDDGGGWGYSTKVVGGVVTRFRMKQTPVEKVKEAPEIVVEEPSTTVKSRRGWSFKFKGFKIGKKKKDKASRENQETSKWTGLGAQDVISESSETSSITSGDVGCLALRGKRSPNSKAKNRSPSSSKKLKVKASNDSIPISENQVTVNPPDAVVAAAAAAAVAASGDQETVEATKAVTKETSSGQDLPFSQTSLGRTQSDRAAPSRGKRSPGQKHHHLDLQRFSSYNLAPNNVKTTYSDLNEVVMKGHKVKEVTVTGQQDDTLSRWKPGSLDTPCRSIENPECEGWLVKLGGSGVTPKNWRRRWFVLKNNCLYYYKTAFDQSALGLITLPSYSITLAPEMKRPFCFKASRENARTYYFVAENQEDTSKWMEKMEEATAFRGPLISDAGTATPEIERASLAQSQISGMSGSVLGSADDTSRSNSAVQ